MSDDFTNEITKALADLESQAPPPPSLRDVRAGGPVPLAARPRPVWYRPAVLVGGAAAVTVLVVGLAVLLGSSVRQPAAPVSDPLATTTQPVASDASADALPVGVWLVTEYISGDEITAIDPAIVADTGAQPAYVEITDQVLQGWTGCNTFGTNGPPVAADGRLTFVDPAWTLAGCLDENFFQVPLLLDALSEGSAAFNVDGSTMAWTFGAGSIRFERSERIPSQSPPRWSTTQGRLDCSPDAVMSFDIPGRDVDAAIIFELFPNVVEVQGDAVLGSSDPFAWGLDGSGTVVAGTAPHDIEPPKYEVFTCSTTLGMRAGADLTGATETWINDLGLGQTDIVTWTGRFIELCSSGPDELAFLAATYVQDDAEYSLAPDGSLPTTEQATETLTTVRSMVCAEESYLPTTTLPIETTTVPGGEACSSLGADGPSIEESFQGIPEPVVEARELLLRLAIACDLEGIVGFAANSAGAAPMTDTIFFWGNAGSVDLLRDYDAETGTLLLLVEALTRVPYEEVPMSEYNPEEVVPDAVFYTWPPSANLSGGRSLADVWDQPTLVAVAALNDTTVDELISSSDEIGGYAGFRVGIRDDGRWLFAIAGD